MSSLGNCLEPQCRDCEDGDYQDKFTKEAKCLRQPYCDPRKSPRTSPPAGSWSAF